MPQPSPSPPHAPGPPVRTLPHSEQQADPTNQESPASFDVYSSNHLDSRLRRAVEPDGGVGGGCVPRRMLNISGLVTHADMVRSPTNKIVKGAWCATEVRASITVHGETVRAMCHTVHEIFSFSSIVGMCACLCMHGTRTRT
jgi:hypothetical protein